MGGQEDLLLAISTLPLYWQRFERERERIIGLLAAVVVVLMLLGDTHRDSSCGDDLQIAMADQLNVVTELVGYGSRDLRAGRFWVT